MPETIYFNGKKYDSLSEMPPNERQMFEKFDRFFTDANQDGVPDVLQAGGLSGLKEAFGVIKDIAQMGSNNQSVNQAQFTIVRETDSTIYVNGKAFESAAEMPSEIRQVYERVVNSSQASQNDIYDETWRTSKREGFFQPHDDEFINRQSPAQPPLTQPPIETVDSNVRFILIIAAALAILGVLVYAWVTFF